VFRPAGSPETIRAIDGAAPHSRARAKRDGFLLVRRALHESVPDSPAYGGLLGGRGGLHRVGKVSCLCRRPRACPRPAGTSRSRSRFFWSLYVVARSAATLRSRSSRRDGAAGVHDGNGGRRGARHHLFIDSAPPSEGRWPCRCPQRRPSHRRESAAFLASSRAWRAPPPGLVLLQAFMRIIIPAGAEAAMPPSCHCWVGRVPKAAAQRPPAPPTNDSTIHLLFIAISCKGFSNP